MAKRLATRIGILGGTFNPIHIGHLAIAEASREKMDLEKVIFVPSYIPPHKTNQKLVPAKTRFKMVKLAIKNNIFFTVSDFEIKRQGKSYSVDTLRHFRKVYGSQARLYFIVGADSLPELRKWREIKSIFKLASFIVVNRPGYPFKKFPAGTVSLALPGIEVSSSMIRRLIGQGRSARYLVPDSVYRLIQKQKLYQ